MPKATKRERQRQNRDLRRQAMLQAEQRRKRLRAARNIGLLLVPVAVILAIVTVASGGNDETSSSSATAVKCVDRKPANPPKTDTFPAAPPLTIDVNAQYAAVLHTSCGDIDIALDAERAPQAVNSFLYLVENQFYNGTTFHRIVTNFVDQGGSPTADGNGGPGYNLPLEAPKDGYKVGDVAMATGSDGSVSGSQFFVVVTKTAAKALDGAGAPYRYSILGQVDAHGLRVAKKINTFGSSAQAGTPTRTIYVFDAGIKPPQGSTTTTATPETTTTVVP